MRYPNGKYHRGEDWHTRHKYPGKCAKCGKEGEKSDFIPLYVRVTSYDSHRILCRLCADCLNELANDLGAKIPE